MSEPDPVDAATATAFAEEFADDFPGWEIWRGVTGDWYARKGTAVAGPAALGLLPAAIREQG